MHVPQAFPPNTGSWGRDGGQAVWPVDSMKDDRRNRLSYLMVARLALFGRVRRFTHIGNRGRLPIGQQAASLPHGFSTVDPAAWLYPKLAEPHPACKASVVSA
jgi:hypothetical protein